MNLHQQELLQLTAQAAALRADVERLVTWQDHADARVQAVREAIIKTAVANALAAVTSATRDVRTASRIGASVSSSEEGDHG